MNFKTTMTKAGLKIKKHSPEILMGVGIITGAAGVFFACKQTLKLNDTIKPHEEYLEAIENKIATEGYTDEYTEADEKREIGICYANIVKDSVKLYALPASLLVCSAVSFCSAYKVLNMRNESIALAYGQLLGTFKDYRAKVIEKYGKEVDQEIFKAATTDQYIDESTGEVVTMPKIDQESLVALFDKTNPNWLNNAEYNYDFIIRIQCMLNDKLHATKILTLNDARKALGLKPIAAGQSIGWYDSEDHLGFVDFGLGSDDDAVRAFVSGDAKDVWLTFNVDGYILDKM